MKHFVEAEGEVYVPFRFTSDPINWATHMDVLALHVPLCALIIMFPLTFYELSKHCKRSVNNTIFIRRFSTYSLTFYVFEGLFSCLAKSIFASRSSINRVYYWQESIDLNFILTLAMFLIFVISMVSITIDAGKGAFTLEWIL